jgi:hypothetical protein
MDGLEAAGVWVCPVEGGHIALGIVGPVLAGDGVVVGATADSGFVVCPLEFIVASTGFLSFAGGHTALGIVGPILAGVGVVVGVSAGSGFVVCPLEFIVASTGFLSVPDGIVVLPPDVTVTACRLSRLLFEAAGAVEVVAGEGDEGPLAGGTTCTRRGGVLCGLLGALAGLGCK